MMNVTGTPTRGTRLRRWLVVLGALLVLLTAYVMVVDRFAERLGADMQKSMRTEPGVDDQKHRPN